MDFEQFLDDLYQKASDAVTALGTNATQQDVDRLFSSFNRWKQAGPEVWAQSQERRQRVETAAIARPGDEDYQPDVSVSGGLRGAAQGLGDIAMAPVHFAAGVGRAVTEPFRSASPFGGMVEGGRQLASLLTSIPRMGYDVTAQAIESGKTHGVGSPEHVRGLVGMAGLPLAALGAPRRAGMGASFRGGAEGAIGQAGARTGLAELGGDIAGLGQQVAAPARSLVQSLMRGTERAPEPSSMGPSALDPAATAGAMESVRRVAETGQVQGPRRPTDVASGVYGDVSLEGARLPLREAPRELMPAQPSETPFGLEPHMLEGEVTAPARHPGSPAITESQATFAGLDRPEGFQPTQQRSLLDTLRELDELNDADRAIRSALEEATPRDLVTSESPLFEVLDQQALEPPRSRVAHSRFGPPHPSSTQTSFPGKAGEAAPLEPNPVRLEGEQSRPFGGSPRSARERSGESSSAIEYETPPGEGFQVEGRTLVDHVLQKVFRNIRGIEVAERRGLPAEVQAHKELLPSTWARLATGTGQRFMEALEGGGPPRRNLRTGEIESSGFPSARKVLSEIETAQEVRELDGYTLAERSLELERVRGQALPNVDHTLASTASTKIKETAADLRTWNDYALQYWADSGGLAPELLTKLRTIYPFYTTVAHVLESPPLRAPRTGAISVAQVVKHLQGSKKPYVPPVEALLEHAQRLYRAGDLAQVGRALADLQPLLGEGVIERTRVSNKPSIAARNFQELARDMGVEITSFEAAQMEALVDAKSTGLIGDVLHVWIDGKKEAFRIHDRAIVEALQSMGAPQLGLAARMFAAPAQVARAMVTASPVFQGFNWIGDQFTAYSQSRYGLNPFKGETIKALREVVRARRDPDAPSSAQYHEFRRTGAGFGMIQDASSRFHGAMAELPGVLGQKARAHQRRAIARRVLPSGKTVRLISLETPMNLLEWLHEKGSILEEGTRFAEFKKAREAGAHQAEAAIAGQDITTFFQMRGSSSGLQAVTQAVPFMNPALQSLYRLGEVLSKKESRNALIGKSLLTVSTLSALLWALNYGDEDIKELRRTENGSLYWHFRVGENDVLRVRKPFLIGQIFGTGIEAVLDAALDQDPEAARDFVTAVANSAKFPFIPTTLNLAAGAVTNKDLTTGLPIEPENTEDLEASLRAGPHNNQTIQELFRKMASSGITTFGVSPAKLEFAIRQLGGRLGTDALKALDLVTGERAPAGPEDLPLIQGFFDRFPSSNTASLRRFYHAYHRANEAQRSLESLRRHAPQRVLEYQQSHERELRGYYFLRAGADQLALKRQQLRQLDQSDPSSITIRDQLLAEMNSIARTYNDVVRSLQPE